MKQTDPLTFVLGNLLLPLSSCLLRFFPLADDVVLLPLLADGFS